MQIGVPKEIKVQEHRVGLTPAAVRELTHHGHQVLAESGCGLGIGCDDAAYRQVGARIVGSAQEVFEKAQLVIKVKEPQASEIAMLRRGQTLFTYLHLAPDSQQTQGLLGSGCTAIAYETVTSPQGNLPLLAPMSEVAGRMAIQAGAYCLEKSHGGAGILLGGVPGVPPAHVVILGGGVVGINSALMAMGLRARVTVLDRSLPRLEWIDTQFGGRIHTLYSNQDNLYQAIAAADLIIGAVLVAGATAPKLITRPMLSSMKPAAALVDVSIDQGGCFETSRPTTHDKPTFSEDGIVHYCVTNMPGAVARTSAYALGNATLPFIINLADQGPRKAMLENPHLLAGLNIHQEKLTYQAVAQAQQLPYTPPEKALST